MGRSGNGDEELACDCYGGGAEDGGGDVRSVFLSKGSRDYGCSGGVDGGCVDYYFLGEGTAVLDGGGEGGYGCVVADLRILSYVPVRKMGTL